MKANDLPCYGGVFTACSVLGRLFAWQWRVICAHLNLFVFGACFRMLAAFCCRFKKIVRWRKKPPHRTNKKTGKLWSRDEMSWSVAIRSSFWAQDWGAGELTQEMVAAQLYWSNLLSLSLSLCGSVSPWNCVTVSWYDFIRLKSHFLWKCNCFDWWGGGGGGGGGGVKVLFCDLDRFINKTWRWDV